MLSTSGESVEGLNFRHFLGVINRKDDGWEVGDNDGYARTEKDDL